MRLIMDLEELIPANKFDLDRATAAVEAGYPAVAPILPDLLEWLQDCNWPVAHVLAPFLVSIGDPLVPHVHRILESDDEVWKYWMISRLMRQSPSLATSFRGYLERLAKFPGEREAHEELDAAAQEVLAQYGWKV